MEIQIQELIDKIKSDGIAEAEQEAGRIVAEAERRAADIVEDARKRAERMEEEAKQRIERAERTAEERLEQAARNVMIELRGWITATLDALLKKETSNVLRGEFLEKVISEVVRAWAAGKEGDLEVILSPEEAVRVKEEAVGLLREHMAAGLEVKPSPSVSAGFRIVKKGESVYYDFTDETLAAYIGRHVGESLREQLKKVVGGEGGE